MRRKSNRKQDEETTYWLSYSDMMAGLLLTFVLIISLTVLRSKIQYDAKQEELAGKEQELIIQSAELENERLTIEEQGAKLNAQELKLSEQEGELLVQQKMLADQQALLIEQSDLLKELQALMDEQQAKLDNIIGIRSALVEDLKKEFDNSDLSIYVDEKTGNITMDSNILFASGQDKLKKTGEEFLEKFIPRYFKILMSPKYSPYISEISIVGHTDTNGSYIFNLNLSQRRAYSVAEYCLAKNNKIFSDKELEDVQNILSATGKSFSNPILNDDGTINADASRRVEIQFRLSDEEMVREMMEILNATYENEKNNSRKLTE